MARRLRIAYCPAGALAPRALHELRYGATWQKAGELLWGRN